MPNGPRYDDDFYAWTQHQAQVLREMPASDNRFDREHVAEELEDLGKSERDAVRSQIRRIIEHLLRLAHSPAAPPRFAWMETIVEARQSLSDKMSPICGAMQRRVYANSTLTRENAPRPACGRMVNQVRPRRCRKFVLIGSTTSAETIGIPNAPEHSHDP
jgi:hypothetical protein